VPQAGLEEGRIYQSIPQNKCINKAERRKVMLQRRVKRRRREDFKLAGGRWVRSTKRWGQREEESTGTRSGLRHKL